MTSDATRRSRESRLRRRLQESQAQEFAVSPPQPMTPDEYDAAEGEVRKWMMGQPYQLAMGLLRECRRLARENRRLETELGRAQIKLGEYITADLMAEELIRWESDGGAAAPDPAARTPEHAASLAGYSPEPCPYCGRRLVVRGGGLWACDGCGSGGTT